jgi:Protein of unknown function (DUF433)
VRGTRVTLDAIVIAFHAGATAEEIAQKFPTVTLADVYQVIAHYLNQPPKSMPIGPSVRPRRQRCNARSRSASIRLAFALAL